jgi:drug/metabolite transporter (DMT)-like permease
MPAYILFILGACLFYAIENVLLEKYLSGVHEWVIIAFAHVFSVTIAWILILSRSQHKLELAFPEDRTVWIVLFVSAALLTCADYCFFKSYTSGGNVSVITMIVVTLPVFATVIKMAMGGDPPTLRVIGAWVLVAAAVWLVSSGQSPEEAAQAAEAVDKAASS